MIAAIAELPFIISNSQRHSNRLENIEQSSLCALSVLLLIKTTPSVERPGGERDREQNKESIFRMQNLIYVNYHPEMRIFNVTLS